MIGRTVLAKPVQRELGDVSLFNAGLTSTSLKQNQGLERVMLTDGRALHPVSQSYYSSAFLIASMDLFHPQGLLEVAELRADPAQFLNTTPTPATVPRRREPQKGQEMKRHKENFLPAASV